MSVRDRIRNFIVDTFFVDDFGDDDSFLRKGLIDSTGMMELVAFIETEFGIKLEDTELVPENLDSLSRVVAFVGHKQSSPRKQS
ncbi:acyl carrier protein [Melittangium boletus]|uniref:Acyl carrier protein n=1 Tax=Melittangium boletus DSM 14713 TaxID=1294270 RepID=A0A250IPD1_9BACT|nr:acyl carrier protein [Melittangium boletus]ATB33027.1 acyl carrier protein [Melittangium boletus DSM 14713]